MFEGFIGKLVILCLSWVKRFLLLSVFSVYSFFSVVSIVLIGGGFMKLKCSRLLMFIVLSVRIVDERLVCWILGIVIGSILD